MEYRFSLDEVLNLIREAIEDGYHYGSFEVVEPDDDDGQSGEGATLWLSCDNCGGEDCVECEPVESVPLVEVAAYGFKGKPPAQRRTHCKGEE